MKIVDSNVKVMPDILEEHFEELEFLWPQRNEALRSSDYTLEELAELEERVAAHTDGLVLAGREAIPFVEEGLTSDDPSTTLAAAYSLLMMGREDAADLVWQAFQKAENGFLEGLRMGMSYGPIDAILSQLQKALDSAPAPVAVSAAEALAFHKKLNPKTPRLSKFLQDEDAQVRRAAWRLIMLGDAPPLISPGISSQLSEATVHDEDPAVRRQAMLTAAWTRQPWVLEHCRKLSNNPSSENCDAILLLAILGTPSDLERILATAKATELGPLRFQALGAFGHPGVVETLLEGIENEDPLTAVAAGAAFTKITAEDIEADKAVQVPPEDGSEPDEFEQEFLDEVTLPNPAFARAHWQKVKDNFSNGTRWCRGLNLSRGATNETIAQLDLESRWQARIRGKFEDTWQGSLINLEVFPQK